MDREGSGEGGRGGGADLIGVQPGRDPNRWLWTGLGAREPEQAGRSPIHEEAEGGAWGSLSGGPGGGDGGRAMVVLPAIRGRR
jgi:hypothetical protein